MRVISGKAKGTRLKSPKGIDIRPTSDRVKESLFNMIAQNIRDSNFLDLFAGIGGIGIEALSRGAKSAFFIDRSKSAIKIIKENLISTKLTQHATIMNMPVEKGLKSLHNNGLCFDIIFCDPPYAYDLIPEILSSIMALNLLDENGIIIIEHSAKKNVSEKLDFTVFRNVTYGDTSLSFIKSLNKEKENDK